MIHSLIFLNLIFISGGSAVHFIGCSRTLGLLLALLIVACIGLGCCGLAPPALGVIACLFVVGFAAALRALLAVLLWLLGGLALANCLE